MYKYFIVNIIMDDDTFFKLLKETNEDNTLENHINKLNYLVGNINVENINKHQTLLNYLYLTDKRYEKISLKICIKHLQEIDEYKYLPTLALEEIAREMINKPFTEKELKSIKFRIRKEENKKKLLVHKEGVEYRRMLRKNRYKPKFEKGSYTLYF